METDFLIIGSGSAGLRAAIEANQYGDVLLITKDVMHESNTRYAQGGIAVAMSEEDTVAFHIEDTLKAGVGLCDETAVRVMVEEGIQRVSEMIAWGANFDKEGDALGFTMEAAHRRRRIVHRGDATGKETMDVLVSHLQKQERVRVIEHAFAADLMTHDDACCGAVVWINDRPHCVFAKATILASGGLGRVYQCTSNPQVATGDGFAAAWRAGCELIDMEFVQFHPTTLFLDGAPHFLISESLRGEGGLLINSRGEQFMAKYHKLEELAPRDVVSRAILNEMQLTGAPCVYLDITHLGADFIRRRFPTIYQTCLRYGIDITTDVIPVRSGAHFMMGGVRTNINAETNIRGLYACGEAACTGVHGANRLASNSLLECIVFGTRAARAAAEYAQTIESATLTKIRIRSEDAPSADPPLEYDTPNVTRTIQQLMWRNAGILRNEKDMGATADKLATLDMYCYWTRVEEFERQNILDVARLITAAALLRTESRGAHFREDYPNTDDVHWKKHIVLRRGDPHRKESE
jgi:L-aspartate oxidase